MVTDVTLLYPYFRPPRDTSPFRFPPLGLGYIAAYLKKHDIPVRLVDCTFITQDEALERVRHGHSKIVGIYSMYSMKENAIEMADLLKGHCDMLIAGGPLPTVNPMEFLKHFDVVAIGEGEQTMLELATRVDSAADLSHVKGVAYKEKGKVRFTRPRSKS